MDDGKSTLIGRLLYDSKGVYEDQLASVRKASVNRSAGPIDFSLLTDGLRAEREQGITIDVAYRYFSTPKRKFIIADTPGHEQYTRNMATGASTAHLAIILVDARNGVLPQSRRHAFIASLLGIPHVVVAVNKMDLVDYSEDVFKQICDGFREFARDLASQERLLHPDQRARRRQRRRAAARTCPGIDGASLLNHLETVPIETELRRRHALPGAVRDPADPRFPRLCRTGGVGRHPAGRSGDGAAFRPHQPVKSIVTFDGDLEEAFAPMSVTVCLEDEIDISRGDMLVPPSRMPHVSRRFEATVVWMHTEPLRDGSAVSGEAHHAAGARARSRNLHHRVNINDLSKIPAERLELNEIGVGLD